jgi:DNA-binding Lrp family transcriptional regulator
MAEEKIIVDELDHQLLHALQLDARLPFARFAPMVGVSEQTIARRFRRLRAAGVVRVVGMVDPVPLGETSWIVRIQSRPNAAVSLADALGRRPDIGWVALTSGGSEIICVIMSRTSQQRDELLLQRLPKTAQVLGVSAHSVMHRFETTDSWSYAGARLAPEQNAELRAQAIGGGRQSASSRAATTEPAGLQRLDAGDELLLGELYADGRTPISRLAEVTGWTPARVNRRLDDLVRTGLLYFEVEVAMEALGFRSRAFLWMTVSAARLQATGEALAEHDETFFVAATTGPTNLWTSTIFRDTAHLYRYVTESLGSLEAITGLEISPSLRRIKSGGTMMAGDRLIAPAPNPP